jgi:ubiquinone/menaquinone biosynthesis C-methylase UbiE
MPMQRFMASQFRKPNGWFGSLVFGRFMNRINRRIINSTLDLLEVRPEHHVLDIGFGGGTSLSRLSKTLTTGVATGVDFSPEMVRQAEARFHRQIAEGRVQVQLGNVSQLPFPDGSFDRVFTVNTIYFWPNAQQGLGEIHRVLKPAGRAAIAIRSREKMETYAVTKYGFTLFSPDEVASLMRQAGFHDIRVDHRDRDKLYDQAIVTGVR